MVISAGLFLKELFRHIIVTLNSLDAPYRICQVVSHKMSFETVDKLRRMAKDNDGR